MYYPEFRQAFFVQEEFHYLKVPRAGTYTVYDEFECIHKCLETPSCLSLNVAASKAGNEKLWCELLTSDKNRNPKKYRWSRNSNHLYIEVRQEGSGAEAFLNSYIKVNFN